MDADYSVNVTNRFNLDFECSDPSEIYSKPKKSPANPTTHVEEKENIKAKPKTANKKKSAKSSNKTAARVADSRSKLTDTEERKNRDNRNEGRRNEGDRPPRRNDQRPMRRDDDQGEGRRFNGPRRFEGGERQEGERRYNDGERRFGGERRFNGERRFDGERRSDGERRFGGERRFDGERQFDGERRFDGERGRGRGRGGRGRGSFRGRDFDRHSGSDRSGMRSNDKRDGAGAYNWGSTQDQIEDAEAVITEEKKEDIDEGIGGSGEESGNEASKEPEEPKEMTLSEYKALMKAKRSRPEFNKRQAGEGENNEQWKNSYALEKKDKTMEKKEKKLREKDSDESSEDERPAAHGGKTKTVLDVDFHFAETFGGRGRGRGRGMGGRGRGRGGMDRDRGYQQRAREQKAPQFDDAAAFPSLK